jgi:arylsulfatase A-like enzyme
MSRPVLHRWVVISLLLGILAGCGNDRPAAPRRTLLDLAAELDLAEVAREPGLVDLGTPEARGLLRRGWSQDEADGARTFVWSDGPESEIEFFLAAPRDVPLALRGEPYRFPGAPAQAVSLILNGEPAGETSDLTGEGEGIVLRRRDLRAGMNRLVLRYAWTHSPAELTGAEGDRRRLGVAWESLRFGTGVDERSRARAAGGRLALPFGWRVSSYLRLPPDAALAIADVRSRDGRPGELRVTVQPEGGEEREVARFAPRGRAETVELGETGTEPVRISLTAIPGDSGGQGLLLRGAVIDAPKAPAVQERIAARAATPASLRTATPAGRPRNVIVYLVDTLRADHVGCYGYVRPVSPRIDAFARYATLFRHAVAQSSWTRPSTATILTGLLPITHGLHRRRHALSGQAVTLAEALHDRGFRTAGFVANGNVARGFGFAQGFETYRLLPRKHHTAADVTARAAEWLDGWDGQAPFFLYLHTVEPHAPYAPPLPFRQRFAPGVSEELTKMRAIKRLHEGKLAPTPELRRDLIALYDADIAANDAAFGDLLDLLVRRGLWQDTMIVFVSDHGEEFFDHGGWEHGRTLHAEMLDVPLIIRIPGAGTGGIVERQVQHADIVPTILTALGLPVHAAVEGRSLLPWIRGGAAAPADDEEAFSWLDEFGVRAASVTTPAWRLIDTRSPDADRDLYDRRSDPGERRDLSSGRRVRTGYLATHLRAAERPRARALRPGEGTMDAEVRQQLQALGYAQ